MTIDPITVTAAATAVYGLATMLLWLENFLDRRARDRQFRQEADANKKRDLRNAYYEAWGYWNGHQSRSPRSIVDGTQGGKIFEALIRLECQLRLNGYADEAEGLGFAIRTLEGVEHQLSVAGLALKLVVPGYRPPTR